MTPLERVARAIASRIGYSFDNSFASKRAWVEARGVMDGKFIDVNQPYQCDYLDAAKAAIEELMAYDDDVIIAGEKDFINGGSMYSAWQAMLRAALEE